MRVRFRRNSRNHSSPPFSQGDDISAAVADWVNYLRRDKLWGLDDPLFPATKVAVGDNLRFEAAGLERSKKACGFRERLTKSSEVPHHVALYPPRLSL